MNALPLDHDIDSDYLLSAVGRGSFGEKDGADSDADADAGASQTGPSGLMNSSQRSVADSDPCPYSGSSLDSWQVQSARKGCLQCSFYNWCP